MCYDILHNDNYEQSKHTNCLHKAKVGRKKCPHKIAIAIKCKKRGRGWVGFSQSINRSFHLLVKTESE